MSMLRTAAVKGPETSEGPTAEHPIESSKVSFRAFSGSTGSMKESLQFLLKPALAE